MESQQKLHERIQALSGVREKIYEKEIIQLHLHRTQCEALCAKDKVKLNEEVQEFIGLLNIGLEENLDQIDLSSIFKELPSNVRERCPTLYDVLDTLFLHKENGRDVSELRIKIFVHALGQLKKSKNSK